MVDVAIHLNNA